ncbi:MAG: phytoene/squalene synthase family protein [Spirochaetaceae bacterium]|nr:MAG: phytoene/squalene synthase family protein [Spirochaetaceae bacterium]
MKAQYHLFRRGSRTYFNSTLFFPPAVRREVFILYGFVRKADNFVDSVPQQSEAFGAYCAAYRAALTGKPSGDPVIDDFVQLIEQRGFELEWVEAFLHAMEMDLSKRVYRTLEESLEYMYGSAEVIGLCMAQIMHLGAETHHSARMLGRAMQYINFIRDIEEDNGFGRTYLPLDETSLPSLRLSDVSRDRAEFSRFIAAQLDRYQHWQQQAAAGFSLMPFRYRVPVKTAADMYHWTACVIRDDPMVVYRRKVKPGRVRIVSQAVRNAFLDREVVPTYA